MKNIKFLALIMALLMVATALVGCGKKLTVEDVKADPMSYVTDGLELTFDKTPLADFFSEGDYNGISAEITAPDFYGEGGFIVDEEAKKATFDFAAGESKDAAEISGGIFYDNKKVVIQSELLTELLGTDSIGVDLGMTLEDVKASNLYNALVGLTGMDKETFEKELDKILSVIDVDAAKKLITDYVATIETLAKDSEKAAEVAEEVLTIGDEEIETIVVTVKEDGALIDSVIEETGKLAKALVALAGEYAEGVVSAEDIDAAIAEAKPPVTTGTTKYYIAAKSAAVVKISGETKTGEGEESTSTKFNVDFGAHPVNEFLPKFDLEVVSDGVKVNAKGETKIEDAKFILDASAKVDGEDEEIKAQFVLENEKTYTATLTAGEEKYTVRGEFITEANGKVVKAEILDPEDGKSTLASVEIAVAEGVKVPDLPKYKNLFDFNEEDLSGIFGSLMMGGMDSYEDYDSFDDGEFEIEVGDDGGIDLDGDGVIDEYIDFEDLEGLEDVDVAP